MDEESEQSYERGVRAAWTAILSEAIKKLGYHTDWNWVAEREGAIAQLRELCGEFGDNDWNDSLNLADIIEKHLARHLWDKDD